jgi:cob(I)alamin adenosyltransferase
MAGESGKIYQSRQDHKQTRLLSGQKVSKDNEYLHACGALDELQSHLGFARSLNKQEPIGPILYAVQQDVMVAGSELASASRTAHRLKRRIDEEDVLRLEKWIDELTGSFGLPAGFVVAGASTDSAALHVARAVSRRCERIIVKLSRKTHGYDRLVAYLNRLSDLLFVAAWSREVTAELENIVRLAIVRGPGEVSAP